MEAYRETPKNPLERFHAEITFPPDIDFDISTLIQGVLHELRPGELRAMGKTTGSAGRLEIFAEGSNPGVYLTGPNTPITNAVAFLLQQCGTRVRRASFEQVHKLRTSFDGPTPELWDKNAEPMASGPMEVRHGAAAFDPEVLSHETP